MNWERIISAWIIFLGMAIISIIAAQIPPRIPNPLRRGAQFLLCLLFIAMGAFAFIAEYYHISFFWAILFAPAICTIALLLCFLYFFLREKRKKRGNGRTPLTGGGT